MLNILKTILIAGGLAYLGLIVSALWITPRALYPVPPIGYAMDEHHTFIDGADGSKIAIRYMPNPEADKLILYHHGNGEDLADTLERLQSFHARGFAALAYDYPGYGHSTGKPLEKNLYASGEATWKHATEELGWKPSQIIHYGYSLGSGVAFELATHYSARAVVIEGAFKSIYRLYTIIRLMPWEPFNNLAKVDKLQAPLLVYHGTEDATVPFSHGRGLAKAGSEGTRFLAVEGAGHTDVWDVAGERFWNELFTFLQETN